MSASRALDPMPMRVLELFCGIGGCAAALGTDAAIVAAIDQNRRALDVYSRNFTHRTFPCAIESMPDEAWRRLAAETDVWWMSPPCTPYTTRGLQRDVDDPRARSLLTVIDHISDLRPRAVALENVPAFATSRAHEQLRDALDRAGYVTRETLLCPTQLGVPNRRARFYLVAAQGGLVGPGPLPREVRPLSAYLDREPDPRLWCDESLARRYAGALDVVDAREAAACTACFTSAYGRSPVRSGSYLVTPSGLRRFSPAEVLRLLGFPDGFSLPSDLPPAAAWSLVGNSLSVPATRWVLGAIPGLLPLDQDVSDG